MKVEFSPFPCRFPRQNDCSRSSLPSTTSTPRHLSFLKKNHPNFQKSIFHLSLQICQKGRLFPFILVLDNRNPPSSRLCWKCQISTAYLTRFDDDFNMGFNGRKLYDKCMVTSQGRSVWPEKLTAGVPIETMVKGRGPHAGAGVHSVSSSGATGTTEDGLWTVYTNVLKGTPKPLPKIIDFQKSTSYWGGTLKFAKADVLFTVFGHIHHHEMTILMIYEKDQNLLQWYLMEILYPNGCLMLSG